MKNPTDNTTIGLEIGRVTRQWRARMDERLISLGLTQSRWLPLRHLAEAGGILPQRRLVELTGIEGPSLVRLLDELERLGFVERRDSETDRRTKTIHLTSKAEPIIGQITALAEGLRKEVLSGITADDLAVFQRTLRQISDNLRRLG